MGLFIQGCIILPVLLPKKALSGEKMPDENLSFIETGVTEKRKYQIDCAPQITFGRRMPLIFTGALNIF